MYVVIYINMKTEMIPLSEIIPYQNNPRKNEQAVDIVLNSIKEYGFLVPIILDKNNIIVAGHTRFKAAIKLGLKEVPAIWVDNLTDELSPQYCSYIIERWEKITGGKATKLNEDN